MYLRQSSRRWSSRTEHSPHRISTRPQSAAYGMPLMRTNLKPALFGIAACLCVPHLATAESTPDIDWPTFLARADLVWDRLPDRWERGAFAGNGTLGFMLYTDQGALAWELGRADVVDNQPSPNAMTAAPRLPLGLLRWRGCEPSSGDLRLNLWNAEVGGTVNTINGPARLRTFTHATQDLIVIQREGCLGSLVFEAAAAVSERAQRGAGQPVANPPPELITKGARTYTVQRLTRGGAHVTAVHEQQGVAFVTIVAGKNAAQAVRLADKNLDRALQSGLATLTRSHQAFWHSYYPESFVSLPDTELESFYWIQMYKLACATRATGPVIDTLGPWYHRTPWPGVWWNLNVQLSYWPVYTANRLELGQSLVRALIRAQPQLRSNAQPHKGMALGRTSAQDLRSPLDIVDLKNAHAKTDAREHGNLLWALHNVWLQHIHSAKGSLRAPLLNMLREAVAYYSSIVTEGPDGHFHVPVAISPEYPQVAEDTNYDVALLSWALQTLLAPEHAGVSTRNDQHAWRTMQQKLPPFAWDETGFLIGKDVPLDVSHRHFSHLLMIYPLKLLSPDDSADRQKIITSLAHWIGKEGALQGYSFVGASIMQALLGNADEAVSHLKRLLRGFVRRNTMYMEAGPVIETPLAAAQAIHELLLQTRGNDVLVFPAVPTYWQDVSFRNLRVPGAFLISAYRERGALTYLSVKSERGGHIRLRSTNVAALANAGKVTSKGKVINRDTIDVTLRAGQTLALGTEPRGEHGWAVAPAPDQVANPFGSKAANEWSTVSNPKSDTQSPSSAHAQPLGRFKWQLLDGAVPTVWAGNGTEEITWRHTSCDPCAWENSSSHASGKLSWKTVDPDKECFDFMHLLNKAPKQDAIAYLRGSFRSDREGTLRLQVGVNDQGRVWWWSNDEAPNPLFTHTGGNTIGKDETELLLPVHKGLNHIFIKTINEGGAWATCVRQREVR